MLLFVDNEYFDVLINCLLDVLMLLILVGFEIVKVIELVVFLYLEFLIVLVNVYDV